MQVVSVQRRVFWMLLGTGQKLELAGVMMGLAAAYAGGRVVASYLYAMRAGDPVVLIGAGATVAAVTVAATIILHGARAARTQFEHFGPSEASASLTLDWLSDSRRAYERDSPDAS